MHHLKPACRVLLLLLLAFPPAIARTADVPAQPLIDPVRLDSGQISGGQQGAVHMYKGIPYAAPPVGKLRWKPPQPAIPWEGVRACTAYGLSCPQPKPLLGGPPEKESEDCLYLNVWTPAKTTADKLPVMVWIHGGGYTTGSGSTVLYDGMQLAKQGVVLVTINYRLGPFGFLAHPLLSKESAQHVSGNYGLLDQIAALQWVQHNIAAFGGDPGCVTIFGESAGAGSACLLMLSPLAKGLFHRAIAESGSTVGFDHHLREARNGVEAMEKTGERIAGELGCATAGDPLAAMRAKSATEILAATNPVQGLFGKGTKYWPCIDGWVIPDDPEKLLAAGKYTHVPFLSGTNANEGTVFLQQLPNLRPIGYRLLVRTIFKEQTDEALKLFPVKTDADVPVALDRLITAGFASSCRQLARYTSQGNSPTFVYQFTRVSSHPRIAQLGAFHSLEIAYVFNNLPAIAGIEEMDRELAGKMSACWVRFAVTGNPNGPGLPEWPAYNEATDRCQVFGDKMTVVTGLLKAECDLYDRLRTTRKGEPAGME